MKHLFLVTAAVLLLFTSCLKEKQEFLSTDKKHTLRHISYGPHHRNTLSIALPKDRTLATPVVIFIHGGAWMSGDKSVFASEISSFADAGIACATINYRYASQISKVHHPELPADVIKAVNFISAKSQQWTIAPDRFGLVGHSAGGHLSLITAYAFNNNKIKACASWAGPVDLTDQEQLDISIATGVFSNYMGYDLNTSADTLGYKQASPYWRIDSTTIPTLLIYATNDEAVPYSNGQKMKSKLDLYGVKNQMLVLDGSSHIWLGQDLNNARNTTLYWFKENL